MSVEFLAKSDLAKTSLSKEPGNRQGRIAVASVYQVIVNIHKSNGHLKWFCKPFLFFCIFVRITDRRTHVDAYGLNL